MTLATDLNLVQAEKPAGNDPVMKRRLRLVDNIDKQIRTIRAKLDGADASDQPRGVWFWMAPDGQYYSSVKYAKKSLEIAKGKTAVQGKTLEDIATALTVVRGYAVQGEFDKQLEAIAGEVRQNFKK